MKLILKPCIVHILSVKEIERIRLSRQIKAGVTAEGRRPFISQKTEFNQSIIYSKCKKNKKKKPIFSNRILCNQK